MAHIQTTPPEAARGRLRTLYDQAVGRTGKVYRIVQLMSPNPAVLEASMALYLATMFGPSGLSRAQREMLATVVSRTNRCRY
jgi:alkylhydroperoxidase family enzyme